MSVQLPSTDESSIDTTTTLQLRHSTVRLEPGPAGTIAAVERDDGSTDHAGPLPPETVAALVEVGR